MLRQGSGETLSRLQTCPMVHFSSRPEACSTTSIIMKALTTYRYCTAKVPLSAGEIVRRSYLWPSYSMTNGLRLEIPKIDMRLCYSIKPFDVFVLRQAIASRSGVVGSRALSFRC